MKHLKITLAIVLTIAMVVAGGCTPKTSDQTEPTVAPIEAAQTDGTDEAAEEALTEIPLPIVEEPIEFSYWVRLNNAEVMETWNDTLSMQELERLTGVHVEFIHPTQGQEEQAYSLMIASKDLPDMIQEREGTLYYPGGGDKAIADGVYIELSSLIEQYAPNYKQWLMVNDTIAKMTITDSGNRWGMFHLTEDAEPAWTGYAVRKDWLDELNLDVPVTLDDWHTVLTAFKNELNVEYPLLIPNTGVPFYNHIISAFDIGRDMYQIDGAVKYGPVQSEYKEYLTLMNQWYQEGILDQDFMGRTDPGFGIVPPENLAATGKSGMFATIWGRTADNYVKSGAADDPDLYLLAIPAPKMTADQQIHFNYPSYQVREGTAITTSCENPEVAMMWLDYQYSKEGSDIVSYGIKGDTYELDENGKAYYTDKVISPQEEGLTPGLAMQKYSRWDGPGVVQYKRMWQVYNETGQGAALEALQAWAQDDIDYVIPPVTMTDEEADEYSNIMPDITTYVNEMTVSFITGVEPLDNFDSFVEQINNMNVSRAIEIQQAALERFNSRGN